MGQENYLPELIRLSNAISEEEQTIRRVRQQAWRVHGLEVAA